MSPQSEVSSRLHHVDLLRAALMLLGVPYHCALFLLPMWQSAWASAVLETLHLWRMPAFFLIAGYFSALVLERKGGAYFLESRLRRIALPLVSAVVLVNLPQMYMVALDQVDFGGGAGRRYLELLAVPGSHWIFHLWFLMNLVCYSLLLMAGMALLRKLLRGAGRLPSFADFTPFALCLIGVFLMGVAKVTGAQLLLNSGLIFYLIPFACGVVFSFTDPGLGKISAMAGTKVIATVGLVALPLVLPEWVGGFRVVELLAVALSGVAMGVLLITMFSRIGPKPSNILSWLVSASLPVYIFHHPVAMACGLVARKYSIEVGFVEFVFVLLLTLAVSLIAAWVVMENKVLRLFLIGDVAKPKARVVETTEARAP